MMSVLTSAEILMNSQEMSFFKSLGARIAQARKVRGLTQKQLADQLGIVQQTYAHYEAGEVRFPASILPILGRTLGLTPAELLDHDASLRKSKPGPVSKLDQQIERIRQLPRAKQRVLTEFLDGFLMHAKR